MRKVQIPEDLFLEILRYHLLDLDSKKFASLKKPVNPNGCLTCPVSPE